MVHGTLCISEPRPGRRAAPWTSAVWRKMEHWRWKAQTRAPCPGRGTSFSFAHDAVGDCLTALGQVRGNATPGYGGDLGEEHLASGGHDNYCRAIAGLPESFAVTNEGQAGNVLKSVGR